MADVVVCTGAGGRVVMATSRDPGLVIFFAQGLCGVAWQGHRSKQKLVSSRMSCQRVKTCI